MDRLSFIIPGEPVPWKRARKQGKRHFTASRQSLHADKLKAAARNAGAREASLATFRVAARFYTRNPNADRDNLLKLVQDALQGIVWVNDRQVRRGPTDVFPNSDDPRTELEIEEVPSAADFAAVLGPKPRARMNRRHLQSSVRRFAP